MANAIDKGRLGTPSWDSRLPDRFWTKTRIEDRGYETPCIIWIATRLPSGYGHFYLNGRQRYAHRIAYEVLIAPIADGLQIDHLCRNPACVNVEHLEAVTGRVNVLRGETIVAANAAKTHCPQGHEYTPENTVHDGRGRRCATCQQEKSERRKAERRAERAARPSPPPRTRCRKGHLLDEANTYLNPRGVRCCRTCARTCEGRYRERKRSGAPRPPET